MKMYQNLWLAVCAPLTMLGLGLGLVFAPLPLTALAAFFGSVSTIVSWVWLWQSEDRNDPSGVRRRAVARNALVVVAAVGALVGFTILLGAGVFPLVIVVLASSPVAVRAYGRWLGSLPSPSVTQLDTMARALSYASPEYLTLQPDSGVDGLTDEELCRRWRDSYATFQHQASAAQLAATVAERQTYLDELERRYPREFAAWLASGATTPGNPLPYLTQARARAESPTIDWDELTRGQDR